MDGVVEQSGGEAVIELRDLHRTYRQGERRIMVLQGAGASLLAGQSVALVGPSGSGKSSLLHIAGLLEKPDAGEVIIDGRDCIALSDKERTAVRRTGIGFVYQFHHLLPEFSAAENVVIPQMIAGHARRDARREADAALAMLGLEGRETHRPGELSGGEQQRVAIARALANKPRVLLADEPTGNLDPETSERVFQQLMDIIRTTGVAALIATHNMELARRMDRVLVLEAGQLVEVTPAAV
ncbi:MAG: ABC transporter ATP-binding protein [Hyphomicrobiaceae bacterium]